MKKRMLSMIPVLVILNFSFIAIAQDKAIPKMVIQERIYNAGEIDEGRVIEHAFIVENQGGDTLLLNKVTPD